MGICLRVELDLDDDDDDDDDLINCACHGVGRLRLRRRRRPYLRHGSEERRWYGEVVWNSFPSLASDPAGAYRWC